MQKTQGGMQKTGVAMQQTINQVADQIAQVLQNQMAAMPAAENATQGGARRKTNQSSRRRMKKAPKTLRNRRA